MNNPTTIDSIISEQIQAQSTIAVNRVMGITLRPLIRDIFQEDNDIETQIQSAVESAVSDIDFSDYISTTSIEDAVSDHLENNIEIDQLVEDAIRDRTDNQLYQVVNDVVNELDMDNLISDSRVELHVEAALPDAVDAALPAAVSNYMGSHLSNFFRSPEGEQILADFLVSHAGRTAMARTFTTILLEHSNA